MTPDGPSTPSRSELAAFETATRDLVGLALRSVDESGLSIPQFRLLLALSESGPMSSTACAQTLGVAGSSVTRLATRLQAAGLLVRGDDPANRSVVTLSPSDAGRQLIEQVIARRRAELSGVLERMDPAVRDRCAAGLEALHQLLGEHSPSRLPV
ncbi:MarR family transcriptional regulator [Gordonia sp. PP30]|uniref:MarR family winged helix-turn-helix transcriptional regulator n=1 Tax=Gordonia sp. PP30 TaxID=2935861 RepID=UPI001FFFD804|nr:MarR family transcriptional regulator [Gordonia sp. PP30]UQE74147.1 MarR family transcriptional regulator [Gordonia sp. PP30]